jgi:hypothetical protein
VVEDTIMGDEEYTILNGLADMWETDRAFYQTIRFLNGESRTAVVAAHIRNNSQSLALMRAVLATDIARPRTENVVLNIPLHLLLDPSGNRTFMDPVAVVPTTEQIRAATETHIGVTNTVCAICQEGVTCATRLRECGHCFHGDCISEWFTMNTRCPVCRWDIRDLQPTNRHTANDRGVHTDEE